MKTLAALILISAAFLGGYHTGRLPGSPDITPLLKQGYDQTVAATKVVSQSVASLLASDAKPPDSSEAAEKPQQPPPAGEPAPAANRVQCPPSYAVPNGTYVMIGGKTYLVGGGD